MEITQEEEEVIGKAVDVATRKYIEKMIGLCKLASISYGSWAWKDLGKWFGSAARWMYNHEDDPILKKVGIRVAERGEMCAGKGAQGCVVLRLDGGSNWGIQISYEHDVDTNETMVTMPGEPERRKTVTETIDDAAWALKRLDELTAVAIRYSKVLAALKKRGETASRERVEKARHQIELLEKL